MMVERIGEHRWRVTAWWFGCRGAIVRTRREARELVKDVRAIVRRRNAAAKANEAGREGEDLALARARRETSSYGDHW